MHIGIIIFGIIVNCIVNCFQLNAKKIKTKDICVILLLQIIGLTIGSKLLDLIMNFNEYIDRSLENSINVGFMFYGGMILAMLLVAIYTRIKKLENINLTVFNNIVILYAIWKLGCFVSGCCGGISQIPLQPVETISCLAIYVGLSLIKKSEYILTLFGVERFASIILRDRMEIDDLIVNMLITSCLIVITLAINIRQKKMKSKN